MALIKLCQRCMSKSVTITSKYCDTCMEEFNRQKIEQNKKYYKSGTYKQSHLYKLEHDDEYREKIKFYQSEPWRQARDRVLVRYKGIDLYEYYINNRFVYGKVIHHIIPRKEDKDRQYDIDNLIALTNENHNKIHEMYKTDKEETQRMLFDLVERWKSEMDRV